MGSAGRAREQDSKVLQEMFISVNGSNLICLFSVYLGLCCVASPTTCSSKGTFPEMRLLTLSRNPEIYPYKSRDCLWAGFERMVAI